MPEGLVSSSTTRLFRLRLRESWQSKDVCPCAVGAAVRMAGQLPQPDVVQLILAWTPRQLYNVASSEHALCNGPELKNMHAMSRRTLSVQKYNNGLLQ
jgi:hypothetical protein